MISVGVILAALGWQAVGAGMLAKGAIDRYASNQAYRRKLAYYAPVDEWWARYGVPDDESFRFLCAYARSIGHRDSPELKDSVLQRLRSCVRTEDGKVKYLLETGGKRQIDHHYIIIMYYASMGRAAATEPHMNKRFPMAGALDLEPEIKRITLQLLQDNGVPDVHWYCEPINVQERILAQMKQR